ncbi:MAG: glycosyl hydrolase 115 family protein [Lewinella sp.]|nr:glycosyl hydrolase 115 family protein [Lewinella sp.]
MSRSLIVLLLSCILLPAGQAQPTEQRLGWETSCVTFSPEAGDFPLFVNGQLPPLLWDERDHTGVGYVLEDLAEDLERVTGQVPDRLTTVPGALPGAIIVGTLGQSRLINRMVRRGRLSAAQLEGKREKFYLTVVEEPLPGIDRALVIVGSDKRGTIYGMYELAELIGVSPWHWWADVPAPRHEYLGVKPGVFTDGEPQVRYRGIFINDEAPALRGWAEEQFGGFNHQFYEKVYELILRNKGNYLWPAMWQPSAFADDDPENARLADAYGVIISTSHHEPMMRAHDEWSRFGEGPWNYETNAERLREFWRGGVERMGEHESVVTVGMRGDGDEAMSEETATGLLQRIIADQREIIAEVSGQPAEETPQVWALYKEVQDYYDKGMRVDDDIMLLFCDDNWGNVRFVPEQEDLDRSGGFGMYYHFDFVGGPVSYRWLNVTQIERVWEQMKLAYDWGIDDLWIVNVGDIKPMELPISFFLELAWNAETITADDLPAYYRYWARQQFGPAYAEEIAGILALYTKYNARRTPEMLSPETYSLNHYREADRIVAEFQELLDQSQALYDRLPEEQRAAFYQLVLSPVEMCSNLNAMYVAAAKNQEYARQQRASANAYAEEVRERFFLDAELTRYFHEDLADGKWNHMMSQTHIGYTNWNNPPVNKMPEITYIQPLPQAALGYVVEYGAAPPWMRGAAEYDGLYSRAFPPFDPVNDPTYYLEVFNRGDTELTYSVSADEAWIQLSTAGATIAYDERVYVSIDWSKVPAGTTTGQVHLSGAGREFQIEVPLRSMPAEVAGFVPQLGVISFEAAHFSDSRNTDEARWAVVPNLGRTDAGMTVIPANARRQEPGEHAPMLTYTFTVLEEGDLTVDTYLSPTLNYQKNEGLHYAIAIDDESPRLINMHEGEVAPDWTYPAWWNNSVTDHIKVKRSEHASIGPGIHTLKVWMVDPGVVFQKFVIDAGGLRASYLGPPESVFVQPD